jgi:hypothetical protein
VNLWIEGCAETDEQRRSLIELAVGVAQHHGYSCRIAADQVELSGNGISGWVLDLENLRRRVADEPRDQWPALVVDHMSTVLSGINLAAETPLNTDNFELIRPLIRTRMYPENAQDTHVPIVSRTLAPGLVQRVVLDQVNTIVPVNRDDLARWPIHERELFELGRPIPTAMGSLRFPMSAAPPKKRSSDSMARRTMPVHTFGGWVHTRLPVDGDLRSLCPAKARSTFTHSQGRTSLSPLAGWRE